MKCCLCGGDIEKKRTPGGAVYWDGGNNPEPLADTPNRCCDTCNTTKVLPARIAAIEDTIKKQTGIKH